MKNNSDITTYVYIDASNIIYGAANAGWKMDFKKLGKYLKDRYRVSKLLYYGGVDPGNLKQVNFHKKLSKFGFELRLIPVKVFSDGSKKADVDSLVTFELMLHKDEYDAIIVFTGDGDYYWVLEYLNMKKDVRLFGCGRSVAKELKTLLKGNVTDVNSLRPLLAYEK